MNRVRAEGSMWRGDRGGLSGAQASGNPGMPDQDEVHIGGGLEMKNNTKYGPPLIWLKSGLLSMALVGPLAVAGPQEDTELAVKEFNRGDLVASMALWRKAAGEGYAPAQVWLGEILDKAEEDAEAVTWYRKAAEQGSAAGELGLGIMHAKGEGVPIDLAKAHSHVLKAAQQNHVPAMVVMMGAYQNGGLGLAADPVQAAAWEAKLVEQDPSYKKPVVAEKVEVKKRRRR
jgi:hypothetical protein